MLPTVFSVLLEVMEKIETLLSVEFVTNTKLPEGSTATSDGAFPVVNGEPLTAVKVPSTFTVQAERLLLPEFAAKTYFPAAPLVMATGDVPAEMLAVPMAVKLPVEELTV